MQTLHRALMGLTLAAVLAAGLGTVGIFGQAAVAQHGQHDQQGQADQRETLAGPLREAFAAMQELHRLHGVIAAELTEEQQAKMNEMVHGMMGAGMAGDHAVTHDNDGEHHDGGHH